MRTWFLRTWDELRTNSWFLPAVMAGAAISAALIAPEPDRIAQHRVTGGWAWAHSGSPEGARTRPNTSA